MKRCINCKEIKAELEFHKSAHHKDGLNSWCKTCSSKKNLEYREKNAERLRENRKKFRLDNIERLRKADREHYYKNAEKERLRATEYRKKYPGKLDEYRVKNREAISQRGKRNRLKLKLVVLNHYGSVCACCGEYRFEFLAIDHINGEGNKHRKETGIDGGYRFYVWLKKNDFPEGFRVLCHNCNMALGIYGYCPHLKTAKRMVLEVDLVMA